MPEKIEVASSSSQNLEKQKQINNVVQNTQQELGELSGIYKVITSISHGTRDFIKSLSEMVKGIFPSAAETEAQSSQRIERAVGNIPGHPTSAPGYQYSAPVSIRRDSDFFRGLSEAAKANFDTIEKGLNTVAKKLNISAPALFAVIYSESAFDPGAVERGGYGGKGLLQFTGATQKLLGGKFDIDSQIKGIEAYFSQRPDQLQKMENARDLKLLTRWGPNVDLAKARAANAAPDNEHFAAAWNGIKSGIA